MIAADGTLYAGNRFERSVYAQNPETGAKLRELTQLGPALALGRNGLIYGSNDSGLFAADLATGAARWAVPGARGAILGADGTLYLRAGSTTIGSQDSRLYPVTPQGTSKWQATVAIGNNPPSIGADGTLYLVSQRGKLTAHDPLTGAEKYSFSAPGQTPTAFGNAAIASDNTVYFTSRTVDTGSVVVSRLFALTGATGALNWTFVLPGAFTSPQFSAPVIGPDGTVYLMDDDNAKVVSVG